MTHYSSQDFYSYDPRPWCVGHELRFLCVQCGHQKPRDNAHRCLSLNVRDGDTGYGCYICPRCGLKGKVTDCWRERPKMSRRERARAVLSRPPSTRPAPPDEEAAGRLKSLMEEYRRAFVGSPGARYLEGRGIPEDVADLAGLGYAERWEHWERSGDRWTLVGADRRVVFPVLDRDGRLVAFSGRAIEAEFCRAKFISRGRKSLGLFTSPNALSSPVLAVTEAAIDALALWLCGVPAVAGVGTTFPDWMPRALTFKSILAATDADEAGDRAAMALMNKVKPRGARLLRFRPRGAKDWGAMLERLGAEALRKRLVGFSEEADDKERINHAWALLISGRAEEAMFIAALIYDPLLRESFRACVRERATLVDSAVVERRISRREPLATPQNASA